MNYPRLPRECAEEIALTLSHIFNLSLVSGAFPSGWKTAKVQPVFKCKGDRNSPMSYRPISLLSYLSKFFESFVRQQLMNCCFVNDQSSGIPQGSVLGLIVIHFRDIPESVKSPSAMFAGDTLIYEVDCSQLEEHLRIKM